MRKTSKTLLLIPALVVMASCSIVGDIIGDVVDGGETGNKETAQLMTDEQVKAKLGNKYSLKMKIVSTDSDGYKDEATVKYAKDGTYTFYSVKEQDDEDEDKTLLKTTSENSAVIYEYSEYEEAYTSATTYSDSITNIGIETLFSTTGSFEYDTKKSVQFLGRACTEYKNEVKTLAFGAGVSWTYTYTVDNELGICFKKESKLTASTIGDSASEESVIEVTEFAHNSSAVDAVLKVETDKILVNEWDAGLYTSKGLKGANIAKPNGVWEYASITESNYVTMYKLSSSTFADAKKEWEKVATSFYQAGANKNSDYESVSSVNGQYYEISEEDHYAQYAGWWETSEDDYEINVDLDLDWDGKYLITTKLYI